MEKKGKKTIPVNREQIAKKAINLTTDLGIVAKKGQGSAKTQPIASIAPPNIPVIPEIPVDNPIIPEKPDSGGADPSRPVGPGNPPRAHQFKPGNAKNPKGYPKGRPNLKTVINYWLNMDEEIESPLHKGKKIKVRVLDSMTLAIMNKARKGDVAAFREMMDRVEGKPVQSTKLLGHNDKALEILIGFAPPAPATNPKTNKDE